MRRSIFAKPRRLAPATIVALALLIIGALAQFSGAAHPGTSYPVSTRDGTDRGGDPDAGAASHALIGSAESLANYDRAFPKGRIPANAYQRGIQEAHSLYRYGVPSGWRQLGPMYAPKANVANPSTHSKSAVSGRVTALAVDPRTCFGTVCRTIYVGAATGGVWKTTNAGLSWTPLTDGQDDLAIGAITLDPQNPDILYVGTGDPDHGGGSHRGIGILRSTDGGRSWTDLGYKQFANRAVSAIVVDPRTAGDTGATLYITSTRAYSGGASSGGQSSFDNPFLPSMGFFVSYDGGSSWQQSNPTDTGQDSTGGIQAQSLVIDPSNPDVLYAGFDFAGVYKSTDDGVTWHHLLGGLPASGFSYLRVAIAPGDPHVLYVAYDASQESVGPEAIYRTSDGGKAWTKLVDAPNACAQQCRANMHLAVDPINPDVVYAGGTANYSYILRAGRSCRTLYPLRRNCQATLMKTTDGGKTWADIGENGKGGPVHPDNHAILIDPKNHDVIYQGGDGGLFHTVDGGRIWTDLNRGLATFQVQALSVGPDGRIYIGTQDNGTLMYSGSGTWTHINSGDGGYTAADPQNPRISYNSNFGSTLYRNDRSGAPGKNTFIAPFWGDYLKKQRGQFYEPFALAPSSPNDLFYGTYRVWRSKIRGGLDRNHDGDATNDRADKIDWVPISFDLSCASKPSGPSTTCDSAQNQGQGISALAVSSMNSNVVAVATANGHLWLTRNALAPVRTNHSCDPRKNREDVAECSFVSGVRWTRIDRGLPQRFPTAIRFAPGSSTHLYVTYSGFDENTPGHAGHLFISTNAGKTWTSLTGSGSGTSLPDLPFNDVVVNPLNGQLYAAADFGVYLSSDGGKSWYLMNQGLPGATPYQLQFSTRNRTLLAALYGRGVWSVQAP